ncbi:MAG TPA: glycosyltransferase [Chitinophagaceae bacterium]|nr:glycosyltransferase [Chitinophagaceae bacterium]
MTDKAHFDFCLLIPCYNNTEGLIKSLQSVYYTSGPFFALVVDDGSQAPVEADYVKKGISFPVTVLRSPQNEGITKALNRGLRWIQSNTSTTYIARLDCGDVCIKERFEKQVAFLNNHPGVGLLGSWCRFVDELNEEKGYLYKSPGNHQQIIKDMHFKNSFMHATVVFRSSVLACSGFYPENFEYAEDYALFWKMCNCSSSAILPEVLTICDINRKGISFSNKGKQLIARWKVVKEMGNNKIWKFLSLVKLTAQFFLPKNLTLLAKRMRS